MKIDLHTHILPERWPDLRERFGYGDFIHLEHHKPCCAKMMQGTKFFREIQDNCWSPQRRIEECDRTGVDVQVLSTVPVMFSYFAKPKDGLFVAQLLNDHIAEIVREFPKRFMGLGTLPLQDAELSISELRRCKEELNLPGVQIGTNVNGQNLNHASLFPVFEAAADMGAAIFVHPWEVLGADRTQQYWGKWLVGMPAETAQAICSVIFGGVLERLPKLRLCFAHGGGSFPATIGRIEHGFNVRPDLCAVDNDKPPSAYVDHIYLDSLVHDERMLRYLIDMFTPQRIALGSDYPFPLGEHEPGKLIDSLTDVPSEDRERLLSGTALEFLGAAKS